MPSDDLSLNAGPEDISQKPGATGLSDPPASITGGLADHANRLQPPANGLRARFLTSGQERLGQRISTFRMGQRWDMLITRALSIPTGALCCSLEVLRRFRGRLYSPHGHCPLPSNDCCLLFFCC